MGARELRADPLPAVVACAATAGVGQMIQQIGELCHVSAAGPPVCAILRAQ
jgi:hypothetical protein